MKTLSEVKDEYAKELGWPSWYYFLLNADGTRQVLDSDYDEVAKLYAKEVAREALRNAADNAELLEEDYEYYDVDKQSILNESNIPKL